MTIRAALLGVISGGAALALLAAPAAAQVRTVDPNSAIDADLAAPPARGSVYYDERTPAPNPPPPPATLPDATGPDATGPEASAADADLMAVDGGYSEPAPAPAEQAPVAPDTPAPPPAAGAADNAALRQQAAAASTSATYQREDLIAAAEGVFGRGAEGLAGILEDILRDQGEPNAYIAGREAGGAFILGVRYGSGTLFHKVEGQRPAYWTGPSVGFDVGGNAAQTFVLVYNLYDTQDLYRRFPAGEGNAYLVGGFTASYLRWGDVVLIPIRLGIGWRLGVNAGYMRFTEKANWVPF